MQLHDKFLNPNQVKSLLSSVSNLKHKTQILIMLHGGLRVSEMLELKLRDIDFKQRVLIVRKSLKSRKVKKRVIPLSDELYNCLVEYVSKKSINQDDLLFTGQHGTQMSRHAINRMLKKLEFANSELAGVGLNPHKLRHTFATMLRANDGNIIDIQEALGHDEQRTTMIYAHSTPDELREQINNSVAKQSLKQRVLSVFKPKPRLLLNLSELKNDFIVGRDKEIRKIHELLNKRVNILITGESGTGKNHLLDAVCSTQKTLVFDDTKEFKKQILNTLLYLHKGDKAKVLELLYKADDQENLKNKISRESLINLCKVLCEITEKEEYILQINDFDNVTPTVVKALEILQAHFTIIGTARKVAIKNTTFLWSFEKVELKNLNRENALKMIHRLTGGFKVEDYSHLKNKIWESSNGNPRMIWDLCDRLGKETRLDRETVSEVTDNYLGKELKQIDMSMVLLMLFGCLAILRYLSAETGNTSLRFIGGCFMIFVLFARYFFNGFKRKSI